MEIVITLMLKFRHACRYRKILYFKGLTKKCTCTKEKGSLIVLVILLYEQFIGHIQINLRLNTQFFSTRQCTSHFRVTSEFDSI